MSYKFRSSSLQSSQPIPAVWDEGTNATGDIVQKFSPRSARFRHHDQQPESRLPDYEPLPELPKMSNRFSSIHNSPPSGGAAVANGALLTPIHNGVRRSSAGSNTSPTPNGETTTSQPNGQAQNAPGSPLSPPSNADSWSSAVGHATTSGKSGRVIERLMADNDRLKRELKEQQTKADEYQQRVQMCQPRIQALEAENGNLTHARDVDQALLARRDRQNTELKEELEGERHRRQAATARAQQLQSERDEATEEKGRELYKMNEETRHAKNHANVLETSFKQMKQQLQAKIDGLRSELDQMQVDRAQDRDKMTKLDVVSDQMRQELERSKKFNADLMTSWDELRNAYRQSTAAMYKETSAETEKARKLSAQMDQVVNEMRWVVGLKKNTELDGSQDSG